MASVTPMSAGIARPRMRPNVPRCGADFSQVTNSCYVLGCMRMVVILLVAWLPGCCCSPGGCGSSAPRAGGPTPYVRCAMIEPPAPFEASVNDLTLRVRERAMDIEGLPETFVVALARGPAPFDVSIDEQIEHIGQSGAKLTFVLGSIGDDELTATRNVAALARLPMPVIVVAGGRDHPAGIDAAISALDAPARTRVVHASGLRRIRLGSELALVPVAGSVDGRYSRDDGSCGIGAGDLEEIAADLGDPGEERRLLLSFTAPSGSAASIGLEGGDAGSVELSRFVERIGAIGGLVAWPEAHAGQVLGEGPSAYAVAAALAGPSVVRAEGSRAPIQAMRLSIGPHGIRATPP